MFFYKLLKSSCYFLPVGLIQYQLILQYSADGEIKEQKESEEMVNFTFINLRYEIKWQLFHLIFKLFLEEKTTKASVKCDLYEVNKMTSLSLACFWKYLLYLIQKKRDRNRMSYTGLQFQTRPIALSFEGILSSGLSSIHIHFIFVYIYIVYYVQYYYIFILLDILKLSFNYMFS